MPEYRVGSSWRTTIVRVGSGPVDERGRRDDDRLVAVVMGGAVVTSDPELAERVCALLNAGDFFEDDEPVEDVIRAFNEGERGRTSRPSSATALSEYPIGEGPPYDEPEGDESGGWMPPNGLSVPRGDQGPNLKGAGTPGSPGRPT